MDPIAELAARVPGGGDPEAAWTAVELRARSVRRRRRLTAVGAAAVVLVAGIAGLLVLGDDPDGTEVTTVPSTTLVESPVTTVPSSTVPVERSACRDGVAASGQTPTEDEALALVGAFLQDRRDQRLSSVRAGDVWACLGAEAAATYGRGELCMWTCGEATVTVPADVDPRPFGSATGQQIVTVLLVRSTDAADGVVREEYRVGVADGRLLIESAVERPASDIDAAEARQALDTFLDALVAQDWDVAAGLLINEGASEEVLGAMPELLERGGAEVADWCATSAACEFDHQVGAAVGIEPLRLSFEVDFVDRGVVVMDVGAFEGQLTVLSLPPLP